MNLNAFLPCRHPVLLILTAIVSPNAQASVDYIYQDPGVSTEILIDYADGTFDGTGDSTFGSDTPDSTWSGIAHSSLNQALGNAALDSLITPLFITGVGHANASVMPGDPFQLHATSISSSSTRVVFDLDTTTTFALTADLSAAGVSSSASVRLRRWDGNQPGDVIYDRDAVASSLTVDELFVLGAGRYSFGLDAFAVATTTPSFSISGGADFSSTFRIVPAPAPLIFMSLVAFWPLRRQR